MYEAISPLAQPFPAMPQIAGVTPRIARAGYKDWGRCDLTYVELAAGTAVAGVFTRNVCCSTEVELGREQAKAGRARALVVNAGNSNAFTGYRGREAVEQIMEQVADHLECTMDEVFVSSTGVIGVPLPLDKARAGVAAALHAEPCSWEDAARTIGTTDTFPKGAMATAMVDGRTVTLAAIIKGSGMIAPDMATMLGYIFTDAAVEPAFLQELLSAANRKSFSCITVDSDTSTSDTVLAFATGKAGNAPLASFASPGADAFAAALEQSASSSHISSSATAKGRRSSSRSKSPVPSATTVRGGSALLSPIRPWSKPRSPGRMPTGDALSWPWARPASLPTATSWRSALPTNGWRRAGWRRTPMTRPRSPPTSRGERSASVSISDLARARRRCGLAI